MFSSIIPCEDRNDRLFFQGLPTAKKKKLKFPPFKFFLLKSLQGRPVDFFAQVCLPRKIELKTQTEPKECKCGWRGCQVPLYPTDRAFASCSP